MSLMNYSATPTTWNTSDQMLVDMLNPWTSREGISMGPMMKRSRESMQSFSPILSADIIEGADDFHVQVDLPGIQSADLDVSVANGFLNIRAERRQTHEVGSMYNRNIERMFGKVQRSIEIPTCADCDSADAKFENGVLTVKFGKKAGSASCRKLLVQHVGSSTSHPIDKAAAACVPGCGTTGSGKK